MALTWLALTDITDATINKFDSAKRTSYLELAELEIVDVGEQLGARISDNFTTPLHHKIKEYAIAWLCYRFCEDYALSNSVESINEMYLVKADRYKLRTQELRQQLSREMFEEVIDEIADRANSRTSIFYRG